MLHPLDLYCRILRGAGTVGHGRARAPPLSEVGGHGGHNLNEGNQGCNSGWPLSKGLKSIIDRSSQNPYLFVQYLSKFALSRVVQVYCFRLLLLLVVTLYLFNFLGLAGVYIRYLLACMTDFLILNFD
jgi:hypothetical protein